MAKRPENTRLVNVFNPGVDKRIPLGFVDQVIDKETGLLVGFVKDGEFYNLGDKVKEKPKAKDTSPGEPEDIFNLIKLQESLLPLKQSGIRRYEEGSDRNLTLGQPGVAQVLDTVFFSNDPGNTYTSWANANAGGGAFTADFDGDGVENGLEYFFGSSGSSFTANPAPVSGVVSWPRSTTAVGVGFRVWQSATLATGSWVDVTASADITDPNFVKFTLPTAPAASFVRFGVFEQP
jgi:hypothetical protein